MAGAIGRKLYVRGPSGQLDVYDPATRQWITKAPMPQRRWQAAAAAHNAKFYITGGFQGNPDGTETTVRTTIVYDPPTNAWTTLAPLPTARRDIAGARVTLSGEARIEVVGGSLPDNNVAYIP
jgi:N-acetylneuraminic acid mutarotase